MTFKETTSRKLFDELYEIQYSGGSHEEEKSKLYWLLEEEIGINKVSIVSDAPVSLTAEQYVKLLSQVQSLKKKIPLQHILGKTYFYGREFKVNKDVLIPRPETEELVHLIIQENKIKNPRILDVGTGSGCIPISLKLEIPSSEVWSIDISNAALEVARENAKCLEAKVDFINHDIFDDGLQLSSLDVIISNPPYVPEKEEETMQYEVLHHEPHLALFVKTDDPLIFYRRIAEAGKDMLKKEGLLYFEIHENYGRETKELINSLGYNHIRIIKDINNKDRIIVAQL